MFPNSLVLKVQKDCKAVGWCYPPSRAGSPDCKAGRVQRWWRVDRLAGTELHWWRVDRELRRRQAGRACFVGRRAADTAEAGKPQQAGRLHQRARSWCSQAGWKG